MKYYIFLCCSALWMQLFSQDIGLISAKSLFNNLPDGDSVTFYQCHVEQAVQHLTTASGQTLTGSSQPFSITEKYILKKMPEGFYVTYYTTSLNVLPNKKFSGLKIKERPYWEFK